jgi:hypothetical protein
MIEINKPALFWEDSQDSPLFPQDFVEGYFFIEDILFFIMGLWADFFKGG